MTTNGETIAVLPEYIAEHLNAPFKVVLLNSVRQIINKDGDVVKTIIPNPKGLLHQVAITRLLCPRKLGATDIKFVRKALGIKAIELSDMLSITPEHLSRCEAGERLLSPGLEKCLRLSVLLDTFKLPDGAEEACEGNDSLKDKLEKFRHALRRVQDLIRMMPISSVYDSEEDLVFAFRISKSTESDSADNEDEDWLDELSKAA